MKRDAVKAALAADDAIESSPVILWNGQDAMRSDDGILFDRVGIGTTGDGAIAIFGTFGSDQETTSLVEFGRLARSAAQARGTRLSNLLAMDGGPSAHILIPEIAQLIGDRGSIYLPNVLCVSSR